MLTETDASAFFGFAADLGLHGVTSLKQLICVAGDGPGDFITNEIELLVKLKQAGLRADMTKVGGSHLLECVVAKDLGDRTRTWRLVARDASAKDEMMDYFSFMRDPLAEKGLKVSDWTWGKPVVDEF